MADRTFAATSVDLAAAADQLDGIREDLGRKSGAALPDWELRQIAEHLRRLASRADHLAILYDPRPCDVCGRPLAGHDPATEECPDGLGTYAEKRP